MSKHRHDEPSTSTSSKACKKMKLENMQIDRINTKIGFDCEVEEFFRAIRNGETQKIEKCLQQSSLQTSVRNDENETLAAVALKYHKLDIYELLIQNGCRTGFDESASEILAKNHEICKNNEEIKKRVFAIHRKYAIESNHKHLERLRTKCKLHCNAGENLQPTCFRDIMIALEELNSISEASILLKIASLCPKLQIIFDFARESNDGIDPKKTKRHRGTTHNLVSVITIGAKNLQNRLNRFEVNGTLIHEICHYVMRMIFDNDAKPYKKGDETGKRKFQEVLEACSKIKDDEELIKFVFEYESQAQYKELIVRVPHIIARYNCNKTKIDDARRKFKSLFDFYVREVIPILNEKLSSMELANSIQEINQICGVAKKIKNSLIKPTEESVADFKLNSTESLIFVSNYPELTMTLLHIKLENLAVFMTELNLKTKKITEIIKEASEKTVNNMMIVVDCYSSVNRLEIQEITAKILKFSKILIVANNKFELRGFKQEELNHQWQDLTSESQENLMGSPVNFQGVLLKLSDILKKSSNSMKTVSFFDLTSNDFRIDQGIIFKDVHVERKFIGENLELSVDETINRIEITKIFLLVGFPGNGKSTEFRYLAMKLKESYPKRWVIYIDLKKHTKVFAKDEKKFPAFVTKNDVSKFIAEKVLKLRGFEAEVFVDMFSDDRVIVLLDGFDEISPSYKLFVSSLSVAIKEKTRNQLWIATRPHLLKGLKAKLKTTFYRLNEFSSEDQKCLIMKLIEGKPHETFNNIQKIIEKIEARIRSPQLVHMIVEIFLDEPKYDFRSANLYEIYDSFVQKLIKKAFKKGEDAENEMASLYKETINIMQYHQNKAVEDLGIILFKNVSEVLDHKLNRIGLMCIDINDKIYFTHRTYKEFFIAQVICEHVFKRKTSFNLRRLTKMFVLIMNDENLYVSRKFLNEFLKNYDDISSLSTKLYLNRMKRVCLHPSIAGGCNELVQFVSEKLIGNVKICFNVWNKSTPINFPGQETHRNILMVALKYQNYDDFLNFWILFNNSFSKPDIESFLLFKNDEGLNSLHAAAENNDKRVLKYFLKKMRTKLDENQIKSLLDCPFDGYLDGLVEEGTVEFRLIFENLSKNLEAEEYKLFLRSKLDTGITVFEIASKYGEKFAKWLYEGLIEILENGEIKRIMDSKVREGKLFFVERLSNISYHVFKLLFGQFTEDELENFFQKDLGDDEKILSFSSEISEDVRIKFKSDKNRDFNYFVNIFDHKIWSNKIDDPKNCDETQLE